MRRDWHISDAFLEWWVTNHVTYTAIHTTGRFCGPDRSKFGEPIICRERRHSIRNPQVLFFPFLLSTSTWIHSQLSPAQPVKDRDDLQRIASRSTQPQRSAPGCHSCHATSSSSSKPPSSSSSSSPSSSSPSLSSTLIDRVDKIQPFIFWFLHCALRSLRRRHHHSLPLFITSGHRPPSRKQKGLFLTKSQCFVSAGWSDLCIPFFLRGREARADLKPCKKQKQIKLATITLHPYVCITSFHSPILNLNIPLPSAMVLAPPPLPHTKPEANTKAKNQKKTKKQCILLADHAHPVLVQLLLV